MWSSFFCCYLGQTLPIFIRWFGKRNGRLVVHRTYSSIIHILFFFLRDQSWSWKLRRIDRHRAANVMFIARYRKYWKNRMPEWKFTSAWPKVSVLLQPLMNLFESFFFLCSCKQQTLVNEILCSPLHIVLLPNPSLQSKTHKTLQQTVHCFYDGHKCTYMTDGCVVYATSKR